MDAITKAEKATTQIGKDGKNRLEIFRFNPGKDKVIFPPHHPYRKVQDADKVVSISEKEFIEKDFEALNKNERFAIVKKMAEENGIHQVYKELNIYESTSIYMYTLTDGYYGYINKYNRTGQLRLGAKADGFTTNDLKLLTKTINSGLDKIPERHKGLVYRGTSLDENQLKSYENSLNNNTKHIELSFMSTSISENNAFNGNTLFVVNAKNAAVISKIAEIEDEQEVLFKANQTFTVKKIEMNDGKRVIYMDED